MTIFTKICFAILILSIIETTMIFRPAHSIRPEGKEGTWRIRAKKYLEDISRIKRAAKALTNTVKGLLEQQDSTNFHSLLSEERESTRRNMGSGESLFSSSKEWAAESVAQQTNPQTQSDYEYEYIIIRVPKRAEVESAHGTRSASKSIARHRRRQKRVVSRPNLSEICEYQNRHRPKRRRLCPLLS